MGLARKLLNLFCRDNSSDVGIFGSKYAGSPLSSTDPDSIQDISDPLSSWLSGWSKAVVSSQAPCMEDMNGVMYVLSYMTKYLYQSGIPEWNSGEDYNQFALAQYSGRLYFCLTTNTNQNPSSSPSYWRPIQLTALWTAGSTYSVGDTVSYNGKTYKCVVGNTANSIFETDFYAGDWDDGNPAGTMIQNIAWQKATLPYHYFDVTGADAGRELSQATYGALYSIIGDYYNNCRNYTANTNYPTPSTGNFRLPDFRNTFFKNSGVRDWGNGHNASHTHGHNRTGSVNLSHSHNMGGQIGTSKPGYGNMNTYEYFSGGGTTGRDIYTVPKLQFRIVSTTNTTSLSVPALSIYNSGSGSAPEPNYYGTRILLKY